MAEACSGDEALRREVESLLNETSVGDGFLDTPLVVVPAQLDAYVKPAARPAVDVREIVVENLGLAGAGLMLGTQRFERCSGPQTGARAEYGSIPQPVLANLGSLDHVLDLGRLSVEHGYSETLVIGRRPCSKRMPRRATQQRRITHVSIKVADR